MGKELTIAETILAQLGGNRFIAMTGSKNFVSDGNSLRMRLARNKSKANFLTIILDQATDTYAMRFFYFRSGYLSMKTGRFVPDTEKEIAVYTDVYASDMCRIFEDVTGLATSL